MPDAELPIDRGEQLSQQGPDELGALRDQLNAEVGDLGGGEQANTGGDVTPTGEDVAGDVGSVALSEEEQEAGLSALDNDPEHPRGNAKLAEGMGDVMRPIEQMINNIQGSKLPDKETHIKDLRERGVDLAEEARVRIVQEKKRYATVRDKAIGSLIEAAAGSPDSDYKGGVYSTLFEVFPTDSGEYSTDSLNAGGTNLSPSQVQELIEETFTVAGANANVFYKPVVFRDIPKDTNGWYTRFHDTNLGNGIKIAEKRILDDETGQLTQLRFAAVSGSYAEAPETPQGQSRL